MCTRLHIYKPIASAVPQALSGFQKALGDKTAAVEAHALTCQSEVRKAESASHYDAYDPLKHGTDKQRAEAKIKERSKLMMSMKGEWTGEAD